VLAGHSTFANLGALVGGQALLRVGVHHQGLSKVWQM
jgi:hypothetical protein